MDTQTYARQSMKTLTLLHEWGGYAYAQANLTSQIIHIVSSSVIVFFIRLEIIRHSHPIISIDFHVIFSTLFHRPKSEYTELDEVGGFT